MKEILLVTGVVGLDQISKWFMVGQGRVILNRGGVWGLLPGIGWTVIVLGLWLALGLYYLRERRSGRRSWGLLVVVAAGLGNVIDRVTLGAVRDFIYYPFLGVYGNIADIILLLGVGLIGLEKRV